ncbi:bifunctional alcohol dehydrogenase/S-(hydroxymethyl)glutathione dehydrogenase [Starmerella bacillaris]|uniref:S-(hydroxymethyl)glutathione dehydrogenase n=1 Tax=Starmerella bacillaris TaxID=1247836 RepID=A0AAV5RJC2_STABA|nr:bifunctional alcohol dehydrogenase/S-(hydroxymethyl)glutathione dehydrogenase [Starmerella bacillaris]
MAQPIKCQAAVLREFGKPLSLETITVDAPKSHEVRVKVLYTALCHTDEYTASGSDPEGFTPSVLGHESAGIVESIGPDVDSVKVGDRVILLYTPECKKCKYCLSGKTNLCQAIRATQGKGVMPDGTSRFHDAEGKPLYHFMGVSGFSQYTVVADISLVAVDPKADLDVVCLLGCGVTTGVGAAQITANVQKGDSVAVWGAGTVGLSVVQGAQLRDAGRIIVLDLDDSKEEWAREFGATDFINPSKIDSNKSISEYLVELTDGGLDFTFDCTGNTKVMRQALESAHKGWGQSIIIGVAASGQEISTRPFQLVTGRVWKGSAFGGVKGRSQLPDYVEQYLNGKLKVKEYITHHNTLADIEKGREVMHSGKCMRCVLDMWPEEKK